MKKILSPRSLAAAASPRGLKDAGVKALAEALDTISLKGGDPLREPWLVDVDASKKYRRVALGACPCLTRSRAGSGGFYVTNVGSRMGAEAMLKLQGQDPDRMQRPPSISKRKFQECIGNAVTATVLARVLWKLLLAIGLADPSLPDPIAR